MAPERPASGVTGVTRLPPPLPAVSVCRAVRVILSPGSRTPPCGGNSSSSLVGSASMRTAAAECQSNCMINGGCGCRNRTERATRFYKTIIHSTLLSTTVAFNSRTSSKNTDG